MNTIIPTIHIAGRIVVDEDWLRFEEKYESVAETIANEIYQTLVDVQIRQVPTSKQDTGTESGRGRDVSMFLNKVFFRVYFSNAECTLEEAETYQVMYSLGAVGELDMLQDWYGYSEWTVLGYDVRNFELKDVNGNGHDLTQIFYNYRNKYAHILIDILEV